MKYRPSWNFIRSECYNCKNVFVGVIAGKVSNQASVRACINDIYETCRSLLSWLQLPCSVWLDVNFLRQSVTSENAIFSVSPIVFAWNRMREAGKQRLCSCSLQRRGNQHRVPTLSQMMPLVVIQMITSILNKAITCSKSNMPLSTLYQDDTDKKRQIFY